jgi:hypothetical protein
MVKMKTYATFNDYLTDQNPKNQGLILVVLLRGILKRVA